MFEEFVGLAIMNDIPTQLQRRFFESISESRTAYQMDEMKTQSVCSKRILTSVGLNNDIKPYDYKNGILIDAEHDFIKRCVGMSANIHDR